MNHLNTKHKGFTLIEILVVIDIIAILAAIVIVAINPKKHFDEAIAAQRDANVNTILNAVSQYIVDEKGVLPTMPVEEDDGTDGEISTTFCDLLVNEYIGGMPTDPRGDFEGAAIADGACSDITSTKEVGYGVKASGNHITVCSTIDTTVCVTR